MCGIIGAISDDNVAGTLLDGLSKLEYRGYDSSGIAIRNYRGNIKIVKAKGKINNLSKKIDNGMALTGCIGIGHTRWATHGEPSEINAHPHTSDDGSVVAVHNGIIENYTELKKELTDEGYSFYSTTDTEVAVKLIDYYFVKNGKDPLSAISKAMERIRGSYAFVIMFSRIPEKIYLARKDSPLIVGVKDDRSYIASDANAIFGYIDNVYYMDNMEIGEVERGKVTFFNINRERIIKQERKIDWDTEATGLNGYDHYMLKEIMDQPTVVKRIAEKYIMDGIVDISFCGIDSSQLRSISSIRIVACGSSYHVGVISQYIIEKLCKIPVRAEYASEVRYRDVLYDDNELVIIISQSGETADSLYALRSARENGVRTLSVVNVYGSSIARESDYVLYTIAGPEIAVATTKAYTAQLLICELFAMELARARGTITKDNYVSLVKAILSLPNNITNILNDDEKIKKLASEIEGVKRIFMIGRGMDYGISLEGSLKLKEVSYIHSEAYPAGELKHGAISLIEEGVLTLGVITQRTLYEKTLSNIMETKSRGARIVCITPFIDDKIEECADLTIYIPTTNELLYPILSAIPLQQLAYYTGLFRGLDVDKPRNLPKSVTVE